VKILSQTKGVTWQVFSKHTKTKSSTQNIHISPIDNDHFIDSFRKCRGVLCGAGFETPAEAMHLGKKLMVIPMKSQYEQLCNAAALKDMGVPVIKKLKESNLVKIQNWIDSDYKVEIEYPNITDQVIKLIFEEHVADLLKKNNWDIQFNLKYEEEKKSSEQLQKHS
jgi:uncharacterized protein (TIGR00661 family)